MDFHGLVDGVQILLAQDADAFDHPAFVEGANLVRFDLGVFGQIGMASGKKNIKGIDRPKVFRGQGQNRHRP